MSVPLQRQVRAVLADTGHLQIDVSTLADNADLYAAGLTSHATVNLMLALEERFDVEFPERFLRRTTFTSVDTISAALVEMGVKEEGA